MFDLCARSMTSGHSSSIIAHVLDSVDFCVYLGYSLAVDIMNVWTLAA